MQRAWKSADALLLSRNWSWGTTPNNHFSFGPPRVELDDDGDDMPNQYDPTLTTANGTGILEVEADAQKYENVAEDTHKDEDLGGFGKRHGGPAWSD